MTGKYILDGHTPVAADLISWAKWYENADRHVAIETVEGCRVSTVFLGLDCSFTGPPPVLFETMVFGGPLDQEQDRYSTWDEAERGHAAMCERVRAAVTSNAGTTDEAPPVT